MSAYLDTAEARYAGVDRDDARPSERDCRQCGDPLLEHEAVTCQHCDGYAEWLMTQPCGKACGNVLGDPEAPLVDGVQVCPNCWDRYQQGE